MNAETKANVLEQLANFHVGKHYGIKCEELAKLIYATPRDVRHAVTALREDGVGVCGTPETGYFVAQNDAELEEYCLKFLRDRALHSLRLISKLTRTALPTLLGQLPLES